MTMISNSNSSSSTAMTSATKGSYHNFIDEFQDRKSETFLGPSQIGTFDGVPFRVNVKVKKQFIMETVIKNANLLYHGNIVETSDKGPMKVWCSAYALPGFHIPILIENQGVLKSNVFILTKESLDREDILKSIEYDINSTKPRKHCAHTLDNSLWFYYFRFMDGTFREIDHHILSSLVPKSIHFDTIPEDNCVILTMPDKELVDKNVQVPIPYFPPVIFKKRLKTRNSLLTRKVDLVKRDFDNYFNNHQSGSNDTPAPSDDTIRKKNNNNNTIVLSIQEKKEKKISEIVIPKNLKNIQLEKNIINKDSSSSFKFKKPKPKQNTTTTKSIKMTELDDMFFTGTSDSTTTTAPVVHHQQQQVDETLSTIAKLITETSNETLLQQQQQVKRQVDTTINDDAKEGYFKQQDKPAAALPQVDVVMKENDSAFKKPTTVAPVPTAEKKEHTSKKHQQPTSVPEPVAKVDKKPSAPTPSKAKVVPQEQLQVTNKKVADENKMDTDTPQNNKENGDQSSSSSSDDEEEQQSSKKKHSSKKHHKKHHKKSKKSSKSEEKQQQQSSSDESSSSSSDDEDEEEVATTTPSKKQKVEEKTKKQKTAVPATETKSKSSSSSSSKKSSEKKHHKKQHKNKKAASSDNEEDEADESDKEEEEEEKTKKSPKYAASSEEILNHARHRWNKRDKNTYVEENLRNAIRKRLADKKAADKFDFSGSNNKTNKSGMGGFADLLNLKTVEQVSTLRNFILMGASYLGERLRIVPTNEDFSNNVNPIKNKPKGADRDADPLKSLPAPAYLAKHDISLLSKDMPETVRTNLRSFIVTAEKYIPDLLGWCSPDDFEMIVQKNFTTTTSQKKQQPAATTEKKSSSSSKQQPPQNDDHKKKSSSSKEEKHKKRSREQSSDDESNEKVVVTEKESKKRRTNESVETTTPTASKKSKDVAVVEKPSSSNKKESSNKKHKSKQQVVVENDNQSSSSSEDEKQEQPLPPKKPEEVVVPPATERTKTLHQKKSASDEESSSSDSSKSSSSSSSSDSD